MNAATAQRIQAYLDKRTDLKTRPLICARTDGVDCVVVIPSMAESGHLFLTLESLARNPIENLRQTLVIVVINHRVPPFATNEVIEDNLRTVARLRSAIDSRESGELRLGYIDAASPGCELPEKGGVGLARKLGLDWGAAVLRESQSENGFLVCLDADTLVEPNYLAALREHFSRPGAWAAVLDYAHPLEGAPDEVCAIVCYEIFLRYHVLGLAHAKSPYAFHSIGSAMACTAQAYAAVAGMNQRQAGEDFYFLQQLAKTGRVDSINATTVYPSSRPSPRVPFGTGQRIRRHLARTQDEYLLYDPASYEILGQWLALATAHLDCDAQTLLAHAAAIALPLRDFLDAQRFAEAWPKLLANSPDPAQRLLQFHRWFDGFRTLKAIHHLRDHGYPQREMFQAVRELLERSSGLPPTLDFEGIRESLERQIALLCHLRDVGKATGYESGIATTL